MSLLKGQEKTSKKPLEKYKFDDKTGLSGVNAKLTQEKSPISTLMVQAEQEKVYKQN